MIEDPGDLFLLNIYRSAGLQVYIHRNAWPSHEFNVLEYVLGEIPENSQASVLENYKLRGLFSDASPYQYDQQLDRIVYHSDFSRVLREEKFDPANRHELTNWAETNGTDRIDLLFTAVKWHMRKAEIRISVFNNSVES